jgi:hypothetical protein
VNVNKKKHIALVASFFNVKTEEAACRETKPLIFRENANFNLVKILQNFATIGHL